LCDENPPLPVLQARAAGVPVVASDVPGIAEVLGPLHGRLCAPGDARALADALRAELLAGRRRTASPGLPLALDEHLARIEEIHGEARSER
jgi:glycosyltransferase involved in cell wall biosynthesis